MNTYTITLTDTDDLVVMRYLVRAASLVEAADVADGDAKADWENVRVTSVEEEDAS